MKKIKLSILAILTLIMTSIIFYSCSDENIETVPQNFIENSLKYENKLYVINEQGGTNKYENNVFKYSIIVKSKNSVNVEVKKVVSKNKSKVKNNEENEFIIKNGETDEFIEILNIQKHENFYTFDLINNLGDRMNNLTYYGDMIKTDVASRCPWCVVPVVLAIIDAFTDSPLEECTNAMKALNCGAGTNPSMVFSDGWFSSSCSVGCK